MQHSPRDLVTLAKAGVQKMLDSGFRRNDVLFLILIFLSACRPVDKARWDSSKIDTARTPGGTYVEASIGDAAFLNPLLSTDSASNDINALIFNGLVKYDKDIKLVGELAERFEIADNGRTITFYLRKNVRWHDGKPFTAADVLFTYQKLIDPNTNTPFSINYKQVTKAEALDPFTFRVYYEAPFAPALESWGMGIIPKHIYESGDINTHHANKNPIGTGPYKLAAWKTDEKVELRVNEDYFEGRPGFDRYIYRIIPDLSVQFLELRQGSLSTMAPTPDQYKGYDEFFENYNKYKYPAFRYDYIAFNLKRDLFKDQRVRKAIAHAIDKKAIIDGVYEGLAVSATGPFPPASWAHNPDVPEIPYDLKEAKRLLADAGWKDSDGDGILDKDGKKFSFSLIFNQGNKVRESIAQVVQENLKPLGIQAEPRVLEWTVFLQKYIDAQNFDACVLAWSLSRDPDCYTIWHSKEVGKSKYNFVSYSNPEADRLLIEGQRTFDQAARQKIYRRLHEVIAADVPYVFLVHPMSLPVVHKQILGVELAPAGLGWNFINWYIPKAWQNRRPSMAAS